ncbi:unnamed protein product (macronuclear) [Paramecium tetraurelia]|uniref:Uncharacterized protein n=1 Tax=Paramecium tetraurelia TaxID=5888 RepID=A0CHB2_PARTE|nr:uncharacterized protein GSPATT00038281001 [Paramecium tetraurelia]CAK70179.1 unnamed protein product [Paramecium tetraurelia]|eukprot:XP_001437576.1 hypothetical protein (macronuclear) [Paramecium tetraurelia strain d4-2]
MNIMIIQMTIMWNMNKCSGQFKCYTLKIHIQILKRQYKINAMKFFINKLQLRYININNRKVEQEDQSSKTSNKLNHIWRMIKMSQNKSIVMEQDDNWQAPPN